MRETSPGVSWTGATSRVRVAGGGVSSTFMSRGRFDALVETSDESLRVLFLAGVIRVECLVGRKVEIWLPRFKSVRILTVKL